MFFKDYDKVDLRARTLAYEAAMARLAERTFSMLGMWRESIAANMKTIAAGKDYAAGHNLDGIYPVDPHAYDFMQYAYLQLGEDHKAKELMEEVGAIKKVFSPRLTTDTALAAVPARYMLERQDWRGAAVLVVPARVTIRVGTEAQRGIPYDEGLGRKLS